MRSATSLVARPAPIEALTVLRVFGRLGLTSFGGPIAHLGYFRNEFVVRRGWLDEAAYADVVALCQFLPGPASSQVGFAIGLARAGWLGGLAAWAGFTLPSALILTLFAFGATPLAAHPAGAGLLHGLQVVAVAIVAQAVRGMAISLCPDRPRATIAVLATILILAAPGPAGPVLAIILGGVAGLVLCRNDAGAAASAFASPMSRRAGIACLAVFAVLLGASFILSDLPATFFRTGALVFGGGHVVLPLLQDAVVAPRIVSADAFLAGYGAAQAVPGPLFTFAAYLGALVDGLPGALTLLVAIFLPGLLLVSGALPFWAQLRRQPRAQSAMQGANAAVAGVLGAALYNPVWTSTIHHSSDFAIALVGYVLLVIWRTPPLAVVAFSALFGMALTRPG